MKIFKYIMSLFVLVGSLNSCTDDDYTMLDGSAQAPALSVTGDTTQVLLSENADLEAVSFSWNEVVFNVNVAPVTYIFEVAAGGTDFAEPTVLQNSGETSFTMTVGQLNARAVAAGILPETQGSLDFRVTARIGESANSDLVSETLTLNVTPYTDEIDISTTWGIVGSATPNGWDGPDVEFRHASTDNEFGANAYLIAGEIKFRENNDWTNN